MKLITTIDRHHGSFDAYLRQGLKLTEEELQRLPEQLTEPLQ